MLIGKAVLTILKYLTAAFAFPLYFVFSIVRAIFAGRTKKPESSGDVDRTVFGNALKTDATVRKFNKLNTEIAKVEDVSELEGPELFQQAVALRRLENEEHLRLFAVLEQKNAKLFEEAAAYHAQRKSIIDKPFTDGFRNNVRLLKLFMKYSDETHLYGIIGSLRYSDEQYFELLRALTEPEFETAFFYIVRWVKDILHGNIARLFEQLKLYRKLHPKGPHLLEYWKSLKFPLQPKHLKELDNENSALLLPLCEIDGKFKPEKVLRQISDRSVLTGVFEDIASPEVRLLVMREIEDADFIKKTAVQDRFWQCRYDAVSRISDAELLLSIMESDPKIDVREAAAMKLNGRDVIPYRRKQQINALLEEGKAPTQLRTSEEIKHCAARYNWDDGYEYLYILIKRKICEKGTALYLYWANGPRYLSQFTDETIELPENRTSKDGWMFRHALEKMYREGKFADGAISFVPNETSYVNEYLSLENNTPIPAMMYEPVYSAVHPNVDTTQGGNIIARRPKVFVAPLTPVTSEKA
jgi:hypothetical protein